MTRNAVMPLSRTGERRGRKTQRNVWFHREVTIDGFKGIHSRPVRSWADGLNLLLIEPQGWLEVTYMTVPQARSIKTTVHTSAMRRGLDVHTKRVVNERGQHVVRVWLKEAVATSTEVPPLQTPSSPE